MRESVRRFAWFVALWIAGVAVLALVAGVLRFAMSMAGY